MIDTSRQLPAPSVVEWAFDLTSGGGPRVIALSYDERHARDVLAERLAEPGHATAAALAHEGGAVIW